MKDCIFCSLPESRIKKQTENYNVILDLYPISEGHTLIIPKKHIQFLRNLEENARRELFNLIIELQNDFDMLVAKQWKIRKSVPMSYISRIFGIIVSP